MCPIFLLSSDDDNWKIIDLIIYTNLSDIFLLYNRKKCSNFYSFFTIMSCWVMKNDLSYKVVKKCAIFKKNYSTQCKESLTIGLLLHNK